MLDSIYLMGRREAGHVHPCARCGFDRHDGAGGHPGVALLYYQRGTAYRAQGDRAHAIADFLAALRIDPQDTKSLGALIEARGALHAAPNRLVPKGKSMLDMLK